MGARKFEGDVTPAPSRMSIPEVLIVSGLAIAIAYAGVLQIGVVLRYDFAQAAHTMVSDSASPRLSQHFARWFGRSPQFVETDR